MMELECLRQAFSVLLMISLHFPSAVAVCPNGSPIAVCACTTNNKGGSVIDCRDKSLTAIPTIVATTQVFDEIIFNVVSEISTKNAITSIPDGAFTNLNVKKIDLTGNPIRQVSDGAFHGLETLLEELILDGPGSPTNTPPPMTAIMNLTNLITLELELFYLPSIGSDTFFAFPNLLNLKLKSMQIQFMAENTFTNKFTKLDKLEVIGNEGHTSFPIGAVRQLTTLRHLSFSGNGLVQITRQSLMTLTNLEVLDLSNNKIHTLEDRCFEGLYNKLETLLLHSNELNANDMTAIKSNSWIKLHQLNIGYNLLGKIPENMFINMPNIAYVNLIESSITSIRRYDFKGLTMANHIDISYNKITSIADGAFLECPILKELDMEQFNIGDTSNSVTVTTATFNGIETNLERLNMENTLVVENEFWDALKNLTKLKWARLIKTGLTAIPECVFKDLTYLQSLYLSDNNISNLKQKMFNGLENSLQTLDMRTNKIQTLDECVFKEFDNLFQFSFNENPLQCDCQLKGYRQRILTPPTGNLFHWIIICQNLQNKRLETVDVSALVCDSNFVAPVCLQPNAMCLPPTTTTQLQTTTEKPTTTPVPQIPLPTLNIGIVSESVNSFQITWGISNAAFITGYRLTYEKLGEQDKTVTVPVDKTKRDINIEGLESDSQYEICLSYTMVDGRTGPQPAAIGCKVARTKVDTNKPGDAEPQAGDNAGVIAGAVVGCVVAVAILVAIFYILVIRKGKSKDKPLPPVHFTAYTPSSMPRTPDNARRWVKTKKETNGDIQINAISSGKMHPDDNSRISAGSYQSLQGNGSVNLNPIPAHHKLGGATGTGRNYLPPSDHKYMNTQSRGSDPPRYVNDPRSHPHNDNGAYSNDVDTRPLPKAPFNDIEKVGHTNKGFNKGEPSPKTSTQNVYHEIPL